MARRERPLSPHLQVYRPQITSILSITHRMTGVALAVGSLFFTFWLASLGYGEDAFTAAQGFMGSWFGILLLMGFTVAFWYHLFNGIRHLMWDAGKGFELEQVRSTGLAVVAAAVVCALVTLAFGFTA
ncbi:MAG: succinate dehydrogenase, cytochrome b556 subunit [Magnetovibrionaceae bacterium]